VLPADTPATLAARILASEHKLYPLALQLLAFGQVRLDGDRIWIDEKVNHELALISPIP
jgi:phosphoribosylglycinamide formyltransferase-1